MHVLGIPTFVFSNGCRQVKLVNILTYLPILSYKNGVITHNSNRHAVQYKRPPAAGDNIGDNGSRFTGLLFTLWLANCGKGQNLKQKWSGIPIRMYAGSLPKCSGFIILSNVSHFSESRKNRPVTVREMLINLLNFPYSAMAREVEKWSGMCILDRLSPKVNQFFRLVGPTITQSLNKIGFAVIVHTDRQYDDNDIQTELIA